MSDIDPDIVAELAPSGTLRAGINLSNFLLVSGHSASGEPQGVAPDFAAAIAATLGADVRLVPYESPGLVADAADQDEWDIALIGAEPARAERIAFSAAYTEIEATYLVPAGSPIQDISEVDREGVSIAVSERSAYDLYLTRNIKHAELKRAPGLVASYDLFVAEGLDVLAGLLPRLITEVEKLPGARILDGRFTAVQQAVGTRRENVKAAAFLRDFVEQAKTSGLIASLIERHGVQGLTVAPSTP